MSIRKFESIYGAPVTIEAIIGVLDMGTCLDIRFNFNDKPCKTFIPLNKIKKLVPHRDEKSWTRIYWADDRSDGYFVVPLDYDELVEYIKSLGGRNE